ncbi:hypothetical protein JQS43_16235 [Natronosporangium hydrolyticum]|uniref:DUF4878 domain-containing protein n=1 Tax=Natronosporangium hydrolyticum TaxID=2811111 RepID=A0A895YHI2_9ACTN|nr:hypothetical protein [Natronosporangium hydrolyticum]QSB13178.1 hypothetical protein JQS43_16235 [Natronosporangium hydrolyticum]
MTTPPDRPGPPPGPGVQPPFVAAPIEGRRLRIGVGLGVAGALVAACCGVGAVAGGGLLVLGQQVINEQAQRPVGEFVGALADQDWETAYDQRCAADRNTEPLSQFSSRMQALPAIDDYQVGDLEIEPGDDVFGTGDMRVPVDVAYVDGTDTVLDIPVEQNVETGEFEVCGTFTPE